LRIQTGMTTLMVNRLAVLEDDTGLLKYLKVL
jgi:hypothetical protein